MTRDLSRVARAVFTLALTVAMVLAMWRSLRGRYLPEKLVNKRISTGRLVLSPRV